MILFTIIAFIVIFSVLVLVHEWGHFYFARRAGVKVEEFGIGLPPRAKALKKDKHGTIFSLNWIPFGGYVRLYGEDSTDPKILKDKKSFASKSIGQRTMIIVAGVLMNFLLAWIIITVGFTVGMKPFLVTEADIARAEASNIVTLKDGFYVHSVDEGSPLKNTTLAAGDLIVRINGLPVERGMVLTDHINPNAVNTLLAESDGELKNISVQADSEGRLGMAISLERVLVDIQEVRYPFYEAPFRAVYEIGRLSVLTVEMLGRVVVGLITKLSIPEGVAGPVGIARMTHVFAQQGLMALLQFTALLSISLGVINIMPFPALDGGRFLFILFELALRRKPDARMEAVAHTVGFALLMLLILAITWNDIAQLIG